MGRHKYNAKFIMYGICHDCELQLKNGQVKNAYNMLKNGVTRLDALKDASWVELDWE